MCYKFEEAENNCNAFRCHGSVSCLLVQVSIIKHGKIGNWKSFMFLLVRKTDRLQFGIVFLFFVIFWQGNYMYGKMPPLANEMQAEAGAQSLPPSSDNPRYRQKQKLTHFLFFSHPFHEALRRIEKRCQNIKYEFMLPAKKKLFY